MTILNRWFEEVWNQGRESAIDELSFPETVCHGLRDAQGKKVDGMDAFKAFHRQFRGAVSDIHITVEDTVTEGDLSVARCTVRAKHSGEGLGKPPKGNQLQFSGMTMVRLKEGKIAEAWNNYDFTTMLEQME